MVFHTLLFYKHGKLYLCLYISSQKRTFLGYPDNESQFRDRKKYIWTNNNVQYVPNFQYDPYGFATNGGYYAHGDCMIKVITDRYGRIIDAAV